MSIKVDKNADNDFRQRRAFQRLEKSLATISSSPLTTKGDLFGFSTSNARIPVGADGTFLRADSSSATGVSWASLSSFGLSVFEGLGTNSATDDIGTSSTAENNFTLASALFGYTFPVNSLTAASTWRLVVRGTFDFHTGSTVRLKVYFGNQSVLIFDPFTAATSGTISVFDDLGWSVDLTLRVLTTGSSGTLRTNGRILYHSAASTISMRERTLVPTVNTTITNQLTLSWQYSGSGGSNAARIHQYSLERIA